MRRLRRWLTESAFEAGEKAPPEAGWLRLMGLVTLIGFVVSAFASEPGASLQGRGLPIFAGTVVFVVAALRSVPMRRVETQQRLGWLTLLAAVSVALIALQPAGIWFVAPYIVAAIGAMRLPARTATVLFLADLVATVVVATLAGNPGGAVSIATGVVAFFLFMRLMRRQREAHDATKELLAQLEATRAAEAEAAALAERGRLAREMHDVLAHSLSALALQLESTRMLAADRGSDPEVTRAVERAHGLAASGLDEARRVIGALRGDELPGPGRLPSLLSAFESESGLACSLAVQGEPRELGSEARLAVYRTAQEALTNVRRHAAAERVEVALAYEDSSTRLVVADHGQAAAAINGHGGYGLTGMRERAELLGGRLAAAPTEDGFCVELWLPA